MSQEVTPEERATRGKRLMIYGIFSLFIVTVLAVFLTTWLIMAPMGMTGDAVRITVIVGAIALIASVIVWFIYTKVILKE